MDVFEAIKKRRAVHHFLVDYEVTDEQLKELFEHVKLTPSGYNVQPWRFVVIKEQDRKQELSEIAFGQQHVADASVNIVVLGDIGFGKRADEVAQVWVDAGYMDQEQGKVLAEAVGRERSEQKLREMAIRNVGMVSMTLLLAAEAMGLATCPMMGFSKWKMRKFLNLPEDMLPGMLISLGYKDEKVSKRKRLPRKSYEELVRFESWE